MTCRCRPTQSSQIICARQSPDWPAASIVQEGYLYHPFLDRPILRPHLEPKHEFQRRTSWQAQ